MPTLAISPEQSSNSSSTMFRAAINRHALRLPTLAISPAQIATKQQQNVQGLLTVYRLSSVVPAVVQTET
jgi:hypothetical protein